MKLSFIIIAILLPILAAGQKTSKINKFSLGVGIDFGHSFTSLDEGQDRWQGKFNPTGALNVLFVNRINQKLIADLAIGFTAYGLILRGKIENYVIDFASPHLSTGISYNFRDRKKNEKFIKMSTGFQLGYRKTFVDEFETYTVIIQGKNRLYPFIKPEIGIRRYFKKKKKGSRYKIAYELGAYFRYNLKTLGTVVIEETDFEVELEPRGSMFGGYFKILSPIGRKRLKMKNKPEKALPPIIYNPRHMN